MSSDRIVEHEIEVSGTPEQVWHAIATGQGITAWFVPTTVEERAGGAIRARLRRRHGHFPQARLPCGSRRRGSCTWGAAQQATRSRTNGSSKPVRAARAWCGG